MTTKSVLITGCSSGIGRSVALGLQQRGYQVFASVRNPDDMAALSERGLQTLPLDLANPTSIKAAAEQVLDSCAGKLFALFNNGAYGQTGALEDLSAAALRQQFETNVIGWHELTRLVLPAMRQQGEGRIIQNSSILGFMALRYRGAYVASKYAIEGLSDTLRLELSGSGIYVSLIEPGPIISKFRDNAYQHFMRNINAQNSVHANYYKKWLERFATQGPVQPFTLPPEAVLKRVIHALESRRPKVRYPVTFPTYLFAALKRVLPIRSWDKLLLKI